VAYFPIVGDTVHLAVGEERRFSLPILNSDLKAAASFRAILASIIERRGMPVASSRMRDFSQSIRIMASMAGFLSQIALEKSSIVTMHLQEFPLV